MYLAKLIKPLGIKTTRLAYGLPVGGSSSTPMRRRFTARSPAATSCKEQIL